MGGYFDQVKKQVVEVYRHWEQRIYNKLVPMGYVWDTMDNSASLCDYFLGLIIEWSVPISFLDQVQADCCWA